MRIKNRHYRTIWDDGKINPSVFAIDQRHLPLSFKIIRLRNTEDIHDAIKSMAVRGAPLLGVAAAYGIYFAHREALRKAYTGKEFDMYVEEKHDFLLSARPTSVNPEWAIKTVLQATAKARTAADKTLRALEAARKIADDDVRNCMRIGRYGSKIIKEIRRYSGQNTVNVLTHCNAGWLACIDYGTALSPVYISAERGIPVHVWVEETRPRNQGGKLTAYELEQMGIPHTVITDNAGGQVMQTGKADVVFVGADRITKSGDVCNKVGTYKTALAAYDNNIPFYVCAPLSSFDTGINDGIEEIEIEERNSDEVRIADDGKQRVLMCNPGSRVFNPGFDITPSRLITGIITEKGIIKADEYHIKGLFTGRK